MNRKSNRGEGAGGQKGTAKSLAAVITRLRARLQARYEGTLPGQAERIDDALETAESAAWCTMFPHLFLPDFAELQIARLSGISAGA
ncbi:MAG TPA: hypothetical protein VIM48_05000 [Chthoniobacterales bacterium]